MNGKAFFDYYEILQLSPNADHDTIERVFRILAKRFHPDNEITGDMERFELVSEARRVLLDPELRAQYDARYEKEMGHKWTIFDETTSAEEYGKDLRINNSILAILYSARRINTRDAGVGIVEIEMRLGCPRNHVNFHMWYLKEKGWIRINESGQYEITAEGVDESIRKGSALEEMRLLEGPDTIHVPPKDNKTDNGQP